MYSAPQKRSSEEVMELRREGGQWLKGLREATGLSQRQFAAKVGVEYFTFISQLETGHGRIPPDRYRVWAEVLGVAPRIFVRRLMRFMIRSPIGFCLRMKTQHCNRQWPPIPSPPEKST